MKKIFYKIKNFIVKDKKFTIILVIFAVIFYYLYQIQKNIILEVNDNCDLRNIEYDINDIKYKLF